MKKEIMIGKSRANYGEDVIEGVTLFKDEKTDEVTGVGILNFKERIKNKDINGLINFMKRFKVDEGEVISKDKSGEEIIDGKKVIYKPLWKFLLEEEKV